jgi:hypothetical protein
MKTIFLRINSQGYCQPHQCATGASYAVHQCPDNASPSMVAVAANKTMIAAPYTEEPMPILFSELGNKTAWINVYWEIKHGIDRMCASWLQDKLTVA